MLVPHENLQRRKVTTPAVAEISVLGLFFGEAFAVQGPAVQNTNSLTQD